MDANQGSPRSRTPSIFINYRREDSAGHARLLSTNLTSRFPGLLVFRDVSTLKGGEDYVTEIENAMSACKVLIVVIGSDWLTIRDAGGKRRLENSRDLLRQEIEHALSRQLQVIPVLVEDARMPEAEDLPPSLAQLARLQAIELSDARWDYDVGILVGRIQEILVKQGVWLPLPTPAAPAGRSGTWKVLLAVVLLVPPLGLLAFFSPWALDKAMQALSGNDAPADVSSPAGGDAAGEAAPEEPGYPPNPETLEAGKAPAAANAVLAPPAPNPAADSAATTSPAVGAPATTGPAVDTRDASAAADDASPTLLAMITAPRSGDKVGRSVRVEGTVSGLGAGHRAFLCFQISGLLYPRGELVPNAEGRWSIQARTTKEDFDTFVVVAATPEAAALLADPSSQDQGLRGLPAGASITSPVVALKRQGRWADVFRPGGKRQDAGQ